MSLLFEYIILPETVHAKLEPNELSNWLCRDYALWLCEPVCAIFNASVCEGSVPSVRITIAESSSTNVHRLRHSTDLTDANC